MSDLSLEQHKRERITHWRTEYAKASAKVRMYVLSGLGSFVMSRLPRTNHYRASFVEAMSKKETAAAHLNALGVNV